MKKTLISPVSTTSEFITSSPRSETPFPSRKEGAMDVLLGKRSPLMFSFSPIELDAKNRPESSRQNNPIAELAGEINEFRPINSPAPR